MKQKKVKTMDGKFKAGVEQIILEAKLDQNGSLASRKLLNIGFLQLQPAPSQFTKVQNLKNGMVSL